MIITIVIAKHEVFPWDVGKILADGKVVATIYPLADDGIKIESGHFAGSPKVDNGKGLEPPTPSVSVYFHP